MESLEGKHSQLKQHDYKTRVNALMKCAEVADEQDLKLFALQNGGQCFGGKNAENTYRKLGPSTECTGTTGVCICISCMVTITRDSIEMTAVHDIKTS